MRVTFLGTGDAWSSGGACNSALLVEHAGGRLLVDCGPTTPLALAKLGLGAERLDVVLVTHVHADHLAGLALVLHAAHHFGRSAPVTIVGPPELERHVAASYAATHPASRPFSALGFAVRCLELDDGGRVELGELSVRCRAVRHMAAPFVALGYRLEADGRVLAVSGDSGACDALADLADGADLFVCECTLAAPLAGKAVPEHLSVPEIAALRASFGARRVVLTHLSQAARATALALAQVGVARDLDVIEV